MSVKRLAHICIGAKDLEATERFYCAGLGFHRAFNFLRKGQRIGYYLKAGEGSFIEVFRQDSVDEKAPAPIRHLCLEVDSVDLVAARLKGMGCSVTDKKLGADHSWQAWTTDPGGVRIEFHEYTPDSCQSTGADCVLE